MRSKLPPILILGDHFGYPGGIAHGVTTYFLTVLPELARSGIEVHACFLREPHPEADALVRQGISPVFLSANKWSPFVVSKVAELVRERGCGIIHAAGIKATLVGRVAARATGSAAILHVHDMHYPSPLVSRLHRLFARPSDLGICVSNAVQEVASRGYHLMPDRLRVIHNGIHLEPVRNVPPDAGARVRAALGLSPNAPVVAMLARMHPVKGHRAMLEIFRHVVGRCPESQLLLAGDGPERAALVQLRDALGLTANVHFLGHRKDVAAILASADVVVVPSQSEGLGLAAVEAMAASKPVVGFDAGGLQDVVHDGVTGRLVPPGDLEGFAASVTTLLLDRTLRQSFGARAATEADRFSVSAHLLALEKCYAEAATARRAHLPRQPESTWGS